MSNVTIRAPKFGVTTKERAGTDMTSFMSLVDRGEFAEAVSFGRASDDESVRAVATMLACGSFTRKRDNLLIAPQPGEGSMKWFWHLHDTQGNKVAYEWVKGVKRLASFKEAWDEGRARKPDGSLLGRIVIKTSANLVSSNELAKARARKQARSARDRETREKMKGK